MPRFDRASGNLEKMPTRLEVETRGGDSPADDTGCTKDNEAQGHGQQWSGPYWLQEKKRNMPQIGGRHQSELMLETNIGAERKNTGKKEESTGTNIGAERKNIGKKGGSTGTNGRGSLPPLLLLNRQRTRRRSPQGAKRKRSNPSEVPGLIGTASKRGILS